MAADPNDPFDMKFTLRAFCPTEPQWKERPVGYRQWRILKGETPSSQAEAGVLRQDLTPSHFEVEHLLGQGNYSQVLESTLRSTQMRVALKVIDKAQVKRPTRRRTRCSSSASSSVI